MEYIKPFEKSRTGQKDVFDWMMKDESRENKGDYEVMSD